MRYEADGTFNNACVKMKFGVESICIFFLLKLGRQLQKERKTTRARAVNLGEKDKLIIAEMARTGKKSVKSRPSLMRKQMTTNRRVQKRSNAQDRVLKDALDKELNSEDITVRKLVTKIDNGKSDQKKVDDSLSASFDQLRGL